MARVAINLERDLLPVSDFRAHASDVIDQVRSSGRPVVLTQRGRAAAVLLDVAAYEALLAENETLRAIVAGLEDREAGRVASQEAARTRVPTRLG